MPRDIGTGLYHYPDGTPGNPAQTIFSTRYNTFINDLANTMNQKLPINMGGTGADNATQARDNLDAEREGQEVTNYDTHVFEGGSFWSNSAATNAPVPGVGFIGIAYLYSHDSGNWMFIEARNMNDTVVPGRVYVRSRQGGVWSAWAEQGGSVAELDARFVNVAGDTMTGNLSLTLADPTIHFNKAAAANVNQIYAMANSVPQWLLRIGDATLGDFNLYRMNDVGDIIDIVFAISRANGSANFTKDIISTGGNVYGNAILGRGDVYVGNNGANTALRFTNDPSSRYLAFNLGRFSLGGGPLDILGGDLSVNPGNINAYQKINHAGSIVATGVMGGSFYNLDGGQNTITAASGALITILENFSGIVIVNSHTNGNCEAFICGGGVAMRFASSTGTTLIGAAAAPPENGYAFYNQTGLTSAFGLISFRTRPGY